MIDIKWDEAGYPDEDSLLQIVDYKNTNEEFRVETCFELLKRVLKECSEVNCSSYYLVTTPDYEEIHFSTGGWSGAEALIAAILCNPLLSYYLETWRRGGHYTLVYH